MHLDHIEPKSRNPARTFDHQNLLLSAIDDAKARTLVKQDDKLRDDPAALDHFAEVELCLTDDQLRPFHSAVRQRFIPVSEQIIKHCCAECY